MCERNIDQLPEGKGREGKGSQLGPGWVSQLVTALS